MPDYQRIETLANEEAIHQGWPIADAVQ